MAMAMAENERWIDIRGRILPCFWRGITQNRGAHCPVEPTLGKLSGEIKLTGKLSGKLSAGPRQPVPGYWPAGWLIDAGFIGASKN